MQRAFVLIKTENPAERRLLQEIHAIEGVKEAHYVYGMFDIIVKLEAETLTKLNHIILGRLRRIRRIQSTVTTIVVA